MKRILGDMTDEEIRLALKKKTKSGHSKAMTNIWKDSTNFTDKLGDIYVERLKRTKVCLVCGVDYVPVANQYKRQKYCSMSCKNKKAWERNKEKGIHKGGYSRHVPIILFLNAMGIDKHLAPCEYCGTKLEPTNFVIDHKIPRSIVLDKHKIKNDIQNMVLCCKDCNNMKGSENYKTFKARVAVNDAQVHD